MPKGTMTTKAQTPTPNCSQCAVTNPALSGNAVLPSMMQLYRQTAGTRQTAAPNAPDRRLQIFRPKTPLADFEALHQDPLADQVSATV